MTKLYKTLRRLLCIHETNYIGKDELWGNGKINEVTYHYCCIKCWKTIEVKSPHFIPIKRSEKNNYRYTKNYVKRLALRD